MCIERANLYYEYMHTLPSGKGIKASSSSGTAACTPPAAARSEWDAIATGDLSMDPADFGPLGAKLTRVSLESLVHALNALPTLYKLRLVHSRTSKKT